MEEIGEFVETQLRGGKVTPGSSPEVSPRPFFFFFFWSMALPRSVQCPFQTPFPPSACWVLVAINSCGRDISFSDVSSIAMWPPFPSLPCSLFGAT